MIAKNFPDLYITGNCLPDHYIPMKGDGTKFYNPETKKCVISEGFRDFDYFRKNFEFNFSQQIHHLTEKSKIKFATTIYL